MTASVCRALFPFTLVVALAIWARGYVAVGDGFSAGGIAGLGAALQYLAADPEHAARCVGARHASTMIKGGLALALIVALGPLALGWPPVTHFPRPGAHAPSIGVLELHTAAAFDLGVGLLVYGVVVYTFDRLFPLPRGEAP